MSNPDKESRHHAFGRSDHRLPPSVADGTGWLAHAVRWLVLALVWLLTTIFTRGRVRVMGQVPPPGGVVAFHHNSPLDAIVLAHPFSKAGHATIAMVKAGVFRHALAGPIVRVAGMIPVARGLAEGRSAAFDAALVHLELGHTVFVAPTGTLTQSQVVEPTAYRIGAVRMAAGAGASITPALVLGPHRWGGNGVQPLRFRRVHTDIWVGDPIEVQGDDPQQTTEALAAALHDLLSRAYDAYPQPGPGEWWWPAERGGAAPSPADTA